MKARSVPGGSAAPPRAHSGVKSAAFTPKALHPKAQGKRSATLGWERATLGRERATPGIL